MNPDIIYKIPSESGQKSTLKRKKKKSIQLKIESDVDEEYLKFYQEGLKYRENYGKLLTIGMKI